MRARRPLGRASRRTGPRARHLDRRRRHAHRRRRHARASRPDRHAGAGVRRVLLPRGARGARAAGADREHRQARSRPRAGPGRSLRPRPALRAARGDECQHRPRPRRGRSPVLLRRRPRRLCKPPARRGAARESGEAWSLGRLPRDGARSLPGRRNELGLIRERERKRRARDRRRRLRPVVRERLYPASSTGPRLQGHPRHGRRPGPRRRHRPTPATTTAGAASSG